jgi:phenylalanyl-tRNA synthetase beta chain
MYLSLNWLKEYVDLPKSLSPEKIAEVLTMHTVEVEGVKQQSEKFEGVIVGKILEIQKHPNADRLRLTKVDTGNEKLDIVCGASNIEVGQLVPVATVGTVLPGNIEIREAEVRGEKSQGMLCAEDELGLGDNHEGIMILEKAKIGQEFADYLNFKDTILEVDNKSLSNRPDLWSHQGIARELAVILNEKFKEYKIKSEVLKKETEAEIEIEVKNEDFKLCQRYMAVAIENITVKSSPKWVQERLTAINVKPINNIVDAVNYTMFELGQPMHAFDFSKIEIKKMKKNQKAKIVVRNAKKDEEVITLDGEKRKLDSEMLVIANDEEILAVAGVMGGESSEVDNKTKKILLESANFDYTSIRKTSTKLGLRSEASMRYEKGLDPNLCEVALARAVELIKQIVPGAKVASETIDQKKFDLNIGPVQFAIDVVEKTIGQKIEEKEILRILSSLGFVVVKNENSLSAIIPTWRATKDVEIKEDIIEEIARIYGFNNINTIMPSVKISSVELKKEKSLERKIRRILSGAPAFLEVYNYSFVGEEQLKKLGIDSSKYIKLANPIASHQTILRQSLAPNLLNNVRINQARYNELRLFEIGNIYLDTESGVKKSTDSKESIPYQEKRLALIFAGDDNQILFSETKGVVEYLLESLGLKTQFDFVEAIPNWANKNISALIKCGKIELGNIYCVDDEIAKKNGLKKKIVFAEIIVKSLLQAIDEFFTKTYIPLEKFPTLTRDLAFVVNEKILYNDIVTEIKNFNKYIKVVELFDIYQGEKIGKGNKNLAFHIIYQAEKTLTSEEVDQWQNDLIKKIEERFEAKVRNF